jgi:hypothetical protein
MKMKSKIGLAAICIVMLVGCATTSVNQETLVKNLAWDVGYLGYTFSPHTQKLLIAGCNTLALLGDSNEQVKLDFLRELLSNVWVQANTPQGVALIFIINNLIGQMGLDQAVIPSQIVKVKSIIDPLCDGVAQATKLQAK